MKGHGFCSKQRPLRAGEQAFDDFLNAYCPDLLKEPCAGSREYKTREEQKKRMMKDHIDLILGWIRS